MFENEKFDEILTVLRKGGTILYTPTCRKEIYERMFVCITAFTVPSSFKKVGDQFLFSCESLRSIEFESFCV